MNISSLVRIFPGFRLNSNFLIFHSKRMLFSEKTLKILNYESNRLAAPNFGFEQKQFLFAIQTNDMRSLKKFTKKWLYTMEKQECEANFPLLRQCLCCIHDEQMKSMKSKSYNFGELVMRMLHFLNLPHRALELSNDQHIAEMFYQLNSQILLCDMLFNNGLYEDLLNVFHQNRLYLQGQGLSSSRFQNLFMYAACYKMNTKQHFVYSLQIWNASNKDHQLNNSANFLSMLAINQGLSETALNILAEQKERYSSIIIQLIAHSECGHFVQVVTILRNCIARDMFGRFSVEVIQRIRDNIKKHSATEHSIHLNQILDEIQSKKLTNKITIDEMLCWPINIKNGIDDNDGIEVY